MRTLNLVTITETAQYKYKGLSKILIPNGTVEKAYHLYTASDFADEQMLSKPGRRVNDRGGFQGGKAAVELVIKKDFDRR